MMMMPARLPTADQAARRALGLSAIVCRETMEDATDDARASEMHAMVLRWIETSGAVKALEPTEIRILAAPLGSLGRPDRALAFWRHEHLSVLAWALGKVPAAQAHERLAPRWVAGRIGFLRQDAKILVKHAKLLPATDLAMYATYLEKARDGLARMLETDPTEDVQAAIIATFQRRDALQWLLGEVSLEIQAPLMS